MTNATHLALANAERGARMGADVLYRHAERARRAGDEGRALTLALDAADAEARAERYAGQRVERIECHA